MPDDQRAYWLWISSINQDPASALEPGIDLLFEHPHLRALYVRLAEVCRETDRVDACRSVLQRVQAPDAEAERYRRAALAELLPPGTPEAEGAWKALAGDPGLDPALARRVVDEARRLPQAAWLDEAAAVWEEQLARDTTAIGASFGLGYVAILQNDWVRAEALLRRVAQLAPDDPEAYRELGRIYYLTGKPDAFEEALAAGIEAAEAHYHLEQQLILRGNLGWGIVQRSGDLEKAEALFEENIARSRLLADRETEGFNLYRLASVRVKQHRHPEALVLLDSAAARYATHAPARLAEVQVLRGTALSALFRFSDAESVLEAAVADAQQHQNIGVQIQASIALTQLRYQMGRYVAAREIGLQALSLAQRYRTIDFEIAARMVLGDVERRWGMFEKAQQHYDEALALAEASKNHARARELYDRLGRTALNLQDANAARVYYERMLKNIQERERESQQASAYLGLGQTYAEYKNFEEALRYYDLALANLGAAQDRRLETNILTAKAWGLIYASDYEGAAALLERAHETAAGDASGLYRIEVALANVYLEMERFRDALAHYRRAEAIEDGLQRPSVHWHVLLGEALAHWRLKEHPQAEKAFREAIDVVETLRANLGSSESRSFFVQDKVQVYKYFAAFLEEQGRTAEAFSFTERARSRGLVDLLYTTQQERKLDPDSPADQILEMDRRMRALEQQLAQETLDAEAHDTPEDGTTRAAFLLREYQRADSIYRQVEVNLSTRERMYTFSPLQAEAAQALLAEGEAMIVFNLRTEEAGAPVPQTSTLYVVLPDTVLARPLHVEERALAETIRFFRSEISRPDGEGMWEPAARRLYEMLIEPAAEVLPSSVHHLHLVPESILHYLPFAALQDAQGRFLVERYTLSVAPSATILKLSRERNARRWSYMLLLADPDGRLPGSRREVQSIAQEAPNRRHALIGEQVEQQTFEEVAENYDIIHFATHGNFVARAPWLSHLELHGDVLSVEEIGRLQLDAYLVTLSACETALSGGLVSDVPNGDEWVGLNQAFLAAGTPTVMASLWPIDDRVSSTFMVDFYERLGPEGKSHALAEVQRQFIQHTPTSHPFYWAAFTVIGDPL